MVQQCTINNYKNEPFNLCKWSSIFWHFTRLDNICWRHKKLMAYLRNQVPTLCDEERNIQKIGRNKKQGMKILGRPHTPHIQVRYRKQEKSDFPVPYRMTIRTFNFNYQFLFDIIKIVLFVVICFTESARLAKWKYFSKFVSILGIQK